MAKRDHPATEAETPVVETPEETAERLTQGKGAPTPSRREQEAARKRPLVPGDRKEAARNARAKQAEAREKARVGMANGDERYLTARDRGPQRRYVRDYVDARFSIGEFLIPVMLVIIILSFLPWQFLQVWALFALWAFFLISVLDCIVLGFLVRKRIAAKYGADKVERGLRWYASMRALQLRVMRLPKPQVKRGQYPA
ncbi:hypothetical protein LLS1_17790 [Leifsonia sp. LS1]|uniref:DUF3043 domain-containing protein n=1 Tax=unclassified Leifsonia TaxID=2663824 RepID=UPI001CBC8137|nr:MULTISPECIES: DUF3043 domain-containing protein [unclassified Leifsonia]UAJ78070.1 DUF3043 domain-containing protein [Leifsonia sp. ZF2019]GIT80110.1 hypothetical protein LLS1_17790 [Leifsonia sp. LS1]